MLNVQQSLYTLIDSSEWSNTISTPVFPEGYTGPISNIPYMRVSIVPGRPSRNSYNSTKEQTGIIQFRIFTKSNGSEQKEAFAIANQLDSILEDRQLDNKTSLDYSTIQPLGQDDSDKTMFIHLYTLVFRYYGE